MTQDSKERISNKPLKDNGIVLCAKASSSGGIKQHAIYLKPEYREYSERVVLALHNSREQVKGLDNRLRILRFVMDAYDQLQGVKFSLFNPAFKALMSEYGLAEVYLFAHMPEMSIFHQLIAQSKIELENEFESKVQEIFYTELLVRIYGLLISGLNGDLKRDASECALLVDWLLNLKDEDKVILPFLADGIDIKRKCRGRNEVELWDQLLILAKTEKDKIAVVAKQMYKSEESLKTSRSTTKRKLNLDGEGHESKLKELTDLLNKLIKYQVD